MPTTYLSPGVYVEEVPSAQQPIAGVGTNTVGFIGLVPRTIRILSPNDDYDPKLAETLARTPVTQREKEEQEAARRQLQTLKDRRNERERQDKLVEREVTRLEEQKRALETAIREADAARAAATPPGEPGATPPARRGPKDDPKKAELERVTAELANAKARQGGASDNDFLLPYRSADVAITTPVAVTKLCTNFTEYTERFGTFSDGSPEHRALTHAVAGFFNNGGTRCFVARIDSVAGDQFDRALHAFESLDEVALIAAPGLGSPEVWQKLVTHCANLQDRFAILDGERDVPPGGEELDIRWLSYSPPSEAGGAPPQPLIPDRDRNAAFYFPWIQVFDPAQKLLDSAVENADKVPPRGRGLVFIPPSGHVAGMYARVDAQRGVHKAPANETLFGVNNVRYHISRQKQDLLNPIGVNCIRNIDGNIRVYGGRTIGGDRNMEWKYVNVRRVMLFLKESIDEGTQWVVFEPNDPSLWARIRLNVSAFLMRVWRDGALFGATPEQAFYVKCDEETNPLEVREAGQVVVEVGVAIVRPAEFVVFRITQWSGPAKG